MRKSAQGEGEDFDFEPEEELGSEGAAKAKLAKLREELERTKKERQEYLDGWQRCKADSVNAKKDAQTFAERQIARAKEGMIEDLLPVLDAFDMAEGAPAWQTMDASWRSGIEHIRNSLLDALSRSGLERFGKAGEKFDHALHEAAEVRDDLPGESGEIARVLRYGYRLGGAVLRPAQVIVKK